MDSRDDLFRLIKTMDRNEKGYFKKFAGLHGKRELNYLPLFDAISRQDVYNETRLQQKFRKERWVKNFAAAKQYLYELVLKSLRNFHAEQNYKIRMYQELGSAEILRERGLHDMSERKGRKAERMARKVDEPFVELEALFLRKWLNDRQQFRLTKDALEAPIAAMEAVMSSLQQELDLHRFNYHMFSYLMGRQGLASKENALEFERTLQGPFTEAAVETMGFRQRTLYYAIETYKARLLGQEVRGAEVAGKLLEVVESNPAFVRNYVPQYIAAMNNYLVMQPLAHRYDDLEVFLEKVDQIKPRTPFIAAEVYLFRAIHLYWRAFATRDYETLPGLAEALLPDLKRLHKWLDPSRSCAIHFYFGWGMWINERKTEALSWLNRMLNTFSDVLRRDLHVSARLLRIIIHYELGNTDLVEYLLRAARRYVESREFNFPGEEAFLKGIARLLNVADESERKQRLQQLHEEMARIRETDPPDREFSAFDKLFSWLEARISGKSMVEVLRAGD